MSKIHLLKSRRRRFVMKNAHGRSFHPLVRSFTSLHSPSPQQVLGLIGNTTLVSHKNTICISDRVIFIEMSACNPILSNSNISIPKLSMTILSNVLYYRMPILSIGYKIEVLYYRKSKRSKALKDRIP